MEKGIGKIVEWNLFSPDYSPSKLKFRKMPDTYVSEAIGDEEIAKWEQGDEFGFPRCPILISAQTGRGKNFFITHNLREFAKRRGKRILYISNRTALDYQQKQEIAELTHTNFSSNPANDIWEDADDFSNITVITYHKLQRFFRDKDNEWFQSFSYVVLDECHFFYSDAYFNPFTGYILENIIKRFYNSIRIYMSATFEDVLEPIRFYEGLYSNSNSSAVDYGYHFDLNPYAYEFPRDFSNYTCIYFSKLEQIAKMICESDNQKEKWLIFVTSKAEGKKLCEKLNENSTSEKDRTAIYLDSKNRDSLDYFDSWAWQYLRAKAAFPTQVLITTSVLDNGFSIKDAQVKNIVLCTDDKTEFLQELGRCRIKREEKINLFIRKMTDKSHANRKNHYESYSELFINFLGERDTAGIGYATEYLKEGNPIRVVQKLWNTREDFRRGVIYLAATTNRTIYPQINDMARWRTLLLGKQLKTYDELRNRFGDFARILYKERWLNPNAENLSIAELKTRDLDNTSLNIAKKTLVEFLKQQAEKGFPLEEESKEFETFAQDFLSYYKAAYPKDESLNRGKNRNQWKHTAIINHLEKINEQIAEGIEFKFEQFSGRQKTWILRMKLKGGTG